MSRSDVVALVCWLGFLWIVIGRPLWQERRINRRADKWLRASDDIEAERERMERDRLLLIGGRSGPGPGLERDRFEDDPLACLEGRLPDRRWRR